MESRRRPGGDRWRWLQEAERWHHVCGHVGTMARDAMGIMVETSRDLPMRWTRKPGLGHEFCSGQWRWRRATIAVAALQAVANPEILKGGLISSFLSSSSPSSSSFLLQNEGGAKGGLHGVFGSRGAGAPLDPLLVPPLYAASAKLTHSHVLE